MFNENFRTYCANTVGPDLYVVRIKWDSSVHSDGANAYWECRAIRRGLDANALRIDRRIHSSDRRSAALG
jgi:hypothetical protein